MKIIGLIDQDDVLGKIPKHCKLWKQPPLRAPPIAFLAPPALAERTLEYGFFEKTCI
jgi:hypothetical protein